MGMCDERKAFLTAIRVNPADDVVRLSYADWLDEKGDRGDLDTATAEFIRLGCTGQLRREIRREAAHWLLGWRSTATGATRAENWVRLVPSALAIDAAHWYAGAPQPGGVREGRRVMCSVCLPNRPGHASESGNASLFARPATRLYAVDFEFDRGFLKVARFTSAHAAGVLIEALHRDQPLVEIEIKGLRANRAQVLYERLREIAGDGAAKKFLARCG